MAVSVYLVCADKLLFVSVQLSLLRYENGEIDQSSIIPIIDGGTEGEFVVSKNQKLYLLVPGGKGNVTKEYLAY